MGSAMVAYGRALRWGGRRSGEEGLGEDARVEKGTAGWGRRMLRLGRIATSIQWGEDAMEEGWLNP